MCIKKATTDQTEDETAPSSPGPFVLCPSLSTAGQPQSSLLLHQFLAMMATHLAVHIVSKSDLYSRNWQSSLLLTMSIQPAVWMHQKEPQIINHLEGYVQSKTCKSTESFGKLPQEKSSGLWSATPFLQGHFEQRNPRWRTEARAACWQVVVYHTYPSTITSSLGNGRAKTSQGLALAKGLRV